jgi:hypothetical protein
MPLNRFAKQCRAKSKSTQQLCKNPAAFGMPVCRVHGARKRSTIKTGAAHHSYRHGEKTNAVKVAHKHESQDIKKLKIQLKKSGQIK